jgi:hypothetical protein
MVAGVVVLGALLLGCDSVQGPVAVNPDPQIMAGSMLSDEAWIDANGGTLSCGPYTLIVPAGAVQAPTYITMRQVTRGAWPVELGPDGTQFMSAVTLQMDAESESDPASLNVQWWNPGSAFWMDLGTTHQGSLLSTEIFHFSRYSLG